MTRRVALQMDALASINPHTDTTLRLGIEAQRRGYEVWQYTPDKLHYRDGNIFVRAARAFLHDDESHWFELSEETLLDIKNFDVVWLRQDPPFDMAYLTTTYMLERVHPKPYVVNHPASVRNLPEKWFPTELKQFMTPTLIASDIQSIREFRAEYKDVVIKPLYGHGGNGIFRVQEGDANFGALMETLFAGSNNPWVVQKFLPEMAQGEVRIILIDGKFSAIAGRIPPAGETRAALRIGAKYIKAEATKRHMEICEALSPMLRKHELLLTGIDVIGDWLTEINITSPSSIPPINRLYGTRLEADVWDALEKKL